MLSSTFSVLAFIFLVYKTLPKLNIPPEFSLVAIMDIWRFASGVLGITFLALLLTQVDKILLSKLITLKSYGYYTLAATVAGGLALLSSPITQAFYPKMVEYVASKNETQLVNLYHMGSQLVSILVIPVAMILIFFGKDILYIWSGDMDIAEMVSPILVPLAIGSLLNCMVWMPYQLQLANGMTTFALRVNSIAVILFVPAIFIVTPYYGALGAAWVWALLNAGYVTIGMHFMYKQLLPFEKWAWYRSDIAKQLLSSIFFVAVAKFLLIDFMQNNTVKGVGIFLVYSLVLSMVSLLSNKIKPLIFQRIHRPNIET